MIGLVKIAARNLRRNTVRTLLTIAGAVIALIAFMLLRTILTSWNVGIEHAAHDRLGTRHKVSFINPLPKKYIDDIRAVPGVKAATWANWFGARDPKRTDEFFATLAVDAESTLVVFTDMKLDAAARERWLGNKRGAIIGDLLATRMGWKTGDRIVLEGTIIPGDWEFEISGVYTAASKAIDRTQLFFHWDYLNDTLPEDRRDSIGWVMTRIDDPSKSGEISAAIDRMFDDRDEQTVTMSERNMMMSFMAMLSAMLTALDIVSIIILLVMLLILGNTIAMGVRERTREYAVLRAIGFEPRHVRFFVISEAAVLGVVAGAVGVGVGYAFINGPVSRAVEENMGAWFPYFQIEPQTLTIAFLVAVGLASIASLIPSIQAGRISVTDALRRVG